MTTLSPILRQSSSVRAVRGKGCCLYDAEGRRFLDFTSGIGVTSTGHCHPRVVEAVQRQAGELIHGQNQIVLHPRLLELTERLGDVLPSHLDAVFYANAGTEAIEASLRLAKQATGRTNVVVMHGGFHGRTVGSLSMTSSKIALRSGQQPLMAGVFVAPFPYAYRYGWSAEEASRFCLQELDYIFATLTAPDETAAILVEPILGEGGYVPATEAFMSGLRDRCDENGILFIIDEVQTGVGRTGKFWGHEHFGVRPDVLVTAKGLASGMPLSACAASSALMGNGVVGSQGGTYGGNPLSCAAALATLDVVAEEQLVHRAADLGAHLQSLLMEVADTSPLIGDVRGRGLMVATEFTVDGSPATGVTHEVVSRVEAKGLLLLTCGPRANVIRWIPPLVVSKAELEEAVSIFADALGEATANGRPRRAIRVAGEKRG